MFFFQTGLQNEKHRDSERRSKMEKFQVSMLVDGIWYTLAKKYNAIKDAKRDCSAVTNWRQINPDFLIGYGYLFETYYIKMTKV